MAPTFFPPDDDDELLPEPDEGPPETGPVGLGAAEDSGMFESDEKKKDEL